MKVMALKHKHVTLTLLQNMLILKTLDGDISVHAKYAVDPLIVQYVHYFALFYP